MGIQYLCHLVQVKNDINRRRRRFYALLNPGTKSYKLAADDQTRIKMQAKMEKANKLEWTHLWQWVSVPRPSHPAYSRMDAHKGYYQAQREMKSMTSYMRRIRTELGARFIWNDGGLITHVKFEGKTYDAKAILAMANQYRADSVILK